MAEPISQGSNRFRDTIALNSNIFQGNQVNNFAAPAVPQEKPWTVPRKSRGDFVGREDTLARMAHVLFAESPEGAESRQRCYAISGMGGSGKSEVCVKFAEIHREKYWAVFWLDAHSAASESQSYDDIASQLAVSPDQVMRALACERRSWLLVIDNCDDQDRDYSTCFPSSQRGHILFTTRDKSLAEEYGTSGREDLHLLSTTDARELLLKTSGIRSLGEPSDADQIISLLGSHPLAIIQAGATIKEAGASVSRRIAALKSYPARFQLGKRQMLEVRSKQHCSIYGNVYATLEISASMLEDSKGVEATDALDLLSLASILYKHGHCRQVYVDAAIAAQDVIRNFPLETGDDSLNLSVSLVGSLPRFLRQDIGAEHHEGQSGPTEALDSIQSRFQSACMRLANLSMIILDDSTDDFSFSLHSLVEAWAFERQEHHERRLRWQQAACLLSPTPMILPYANIARHFVDAHVRKSLAQALEQDFLTNANRDAARVIYVSLEYLQATPEGKVLRDALVPQLRRICDATRAENKIAMLEIRALDAAWELVQRQHHSALDVFEELSSSLAQLPTSSPLRRKLAILHVDTCLRCDENAKAVNILQSMIPDLQQTATPFVTMAFVALLGIVYHAGGEFQNAMIIYKLALEYYMPSLPDVLSSFVSLSTNLSKTLAAIDGNPRRAIENMRDTVALQRQCLGHDTALLKQTQVDLLLVQISNEDLEDAEQTARGYLEDHGLSDTESNSIQRDLSETGPEIDKISRGRDTPEAAIALQEVAAKIPKKYKAIHELLWDVQQLRFRPMFRDVLHSGNGKAGYPELASYL